MSRTDLLVHIYSYKISQYHSSYTELIVERLSCCGLPRDEVVGAFHLLVNRMLEYDEGNLIMIQTDGQQQCIIQVSWLSSIKQQFHNLYHRVYQI